MSSIVDFVVHFDGYPLQAYLLENIDLIGYAASCYLVMVGKGDRILRWWNKNSSANKAKASQSEENGKANGISKADTASLKTCFRVAAFYHAAVCAACAVLSCLLVPAMVQSIFVNSFFDTMCIWDDDRIFKGVVGFALGGAVVVKVVEQLDTFFLVLRDYIVSSPEAELQQPRRLTPSHWWYQVLLPLYFWHTYSIGTSCFGLLVAYTIVLSTARNFFYLQQDKAQARGKAAAATKLASTIASLDIVECVGCSLLSVYASYMNYTNERGCMTVQANVRMALVMYITEIVMRVREMRTPEKVAVSEKKKN